jgi:threonine aldolase
MRTTTRTRRPAAKVLSTSRAKPQGPIDLRSDTVTRPTPEMRKAMAAAEVGDDVLDHDPTMAALEERVAGLLGASAALWTPSGSMGNLIALMAHLRRGDSFLAPAGAHVLDAELGTAAWLAGGMPRPLEHDAGPGRISPAAVRRAAGSPGPYFTLTTRLLCLENTHNAAGGTVTRPEDHARVAAAAKAAGLAVHVDGARLWHAAVKLGVPPGALTVGTDTVQVCLSKGLGAPVGSLVAGSTEFVREARRLRKMLGGGVRQGGVLAAAGLVALDRVDRLAEDHARATALAAGLRERGWRVQEPETNIVLVAVADLPGTLARFTDAGVLASSMSGKVRLMTHADVTDAQIRAALERIGPLTRDSPVRRAAPGAS